MDHATDDFLLHIDADFLMPPSTLPVLAHVAPSLLCGENRVLVLPHFDVFKDASGNGLEVPAATPGDRGEANTMRELRSVCRDKESISTAFAEGRATEFHRHVYQGRSNNGTRGVDYPRWIANDTNDDDGKSLRGLTWLDPTSIRDMSELLFAFHRSPLFPRFDEIFAGRGYNRVSHMRELKLLDYAFYTHPDLFLCHPAEKYEGVDKKGDDADFRRNKKRVGPWLADKKTIMDETNLLAQRDSAYQTKTMQGTCGLAARALAPWTVSK
jgi:hypothetical protein